MMEHLPLMIVNPIPEHMEGKRTFELSGVLHLCIPKSNLDEEVETLLCEISKWHQKQKEKNNE